MSEINEKVEDVAEVPDVVEEKDTEGNDTTDWKKLALERQELARKNAGIAQRFKTKLEKAKETKTSETPVVIKEGKTGELDYGQKAYLKASGIEPSEFPFVQAQMQSSGKDIDTLLSNGYFQTELKAHRDAKTVANATPGATRTAEAPATTKVDYWIAKGELPPDPELRIAVVNRKIELARQGRGQK